MIYQPPPATERPVVSLSQWSVFQTETGERHLCGRADSWDGRVSQAISSYDAATRTVHTASGRIYILEGPSGWSRDAEYVKNRWLDINNVSEWHDVTADYEVEFD